jgi:hypothetical protein
MLHTHIQNAKHIDSRFGAGAYSTLLKTLEKNRMDDKNLAARPEIEENESVRWLAETFEAHNPWVRKNYVLAYAQVRRILKLFSLFSLILSTLLSFSAPHSNLYQLFGSPVLIFVCQ